MIQSPDVTKKSADSNLNISYSEPSKKQKIQQIKKQHSAMDDFLKISNQQMVLIDRSDLTNNKTKD